MHCSCERAHFDFNVIVMGSIDYRDGRPEPEVSCKSIAEHTPRTSRASVLRTTSSVTAGCLAQNRFHFPLHFPSHSLLQQEEWSQVGVRLKDRTISQCTATNPALEITRAFSLSLITSVCLSNATYSDQVSSWVTPDGTLNASLIWLNCLRRLSHTSNCLSLC